MDRKHIIGVNQYDVKTVWIEGADTGSPLVGYSWDVVKVLFEYERLPLQGMLDCFRVDASSVETYAGAHPKGVGHPMSQGVDVCDHVDTLG